jgi:hypothetical protein
MPIPQPASKQKRMPRTPLPLTDHLLRDVAGTFVVFAGYLMFIAWSLPSGINRSLALDVWPWGLGVGLCAALVLVVRRGPSRAFSQEHDERSDRFIAGDVILLLFPLTPIVQYVLLNQDILTLYDSFVVGALFGAITAGMVFVIPSMLGRLVSYSILMIASLSFVYLIFNMASMANDFAWHESGETGIQIAIVAVTFSLLLLLYKLQRSLLYALVCIYFAINTVTVAVTGEDAPALSDSILMDLAAGKTAQKTPSVYLMTYDAYVENETMLKYGIDNSEQEKHLQALGFKIYRGNYTVGGATLVSMGNMLSPGNKKGATSGDGAVQRIFRRLGYDTFGVFKNDYFFRDEQSSYDHSFPRRAASYPVLVRAILEGEFRFDIGFEDTDRAKFLERKRETLSGGKSPPKFLFTLTGPSHSQNSGACLDREIDLFARRLETANVEMQEDIANILENDENAIVIINGDHGPYLSRNCTVLRSHEFPASEVNRLDIQDRFGAFLAIRWPDDPEVARYDRIAKLQDVFPAIFAYVFGDPGILDARLPDEILASQRERISGLSVENDIIIGGADDGTRLFESRVGP